MCFQRPSATPSDRHTDVRIGRGSKGGVLQEVRPESTEPLAPSSSWAWFKLTRGKQTRQATHTPRKNPLPLPSSVVILWRVLPRCTGTFTPEIPCPSNPHAGCALHVLGSSGLPTIVRSPAQTDFSGGSWTCTAAWSPPQESVNPCLADPSSWRQLPFWMRLPAKFDAKPCFRLQAAGPLRCLLLPSDQDLQ